jgi:AbrB family transcriptional regulator (stage V sporulation protein T)
VSDTLIKDVSPPDQEVAPQADTPPTVDDMAEAAEGPLRIGPKRQIVLPAETLRSLGVEEGDELCVLVEDDMIKLMTRRRLIQLIQDEACAVPYEGSMVDELIAERRREAARERREMEED